jgi:hypothetical protein
VKLLKHYKVDNFRLKKASPACESSRRIAIETIKPRTPENAPKPKYNLPIILWFVENKQRLTHGF